MKWDCYIIEHLLERKAKDVTSSNYHEVARRAFDWTMSLVRIYPGRASKTRRVDVAILNFE